MAVDFLVPPSGVDPTRPFLMLLAGLSGGSHEGYIRDMVQEAVLRRGMAVAIMIARGASGTPCTSGELFHGARVSDFAATIALMRRAAEAAAAAAGGGGATGRGKGRRGGEAAHPAVRVYGVGVSMGGIILPNCEC